MLSFILVLVVASSAFAAPSVLVSQYNVNEIPPVADNGRPSSAIENAFDVANDGGETNVYTLTNQQIIYDMGNLPDSDSQALAVGQTIAVLGDLVYGIPGDACSAATLINAYASGNNAAIRNALVNYIQNLGSDIDAIVQVIQNPNSVRYATGRKGNCANGGRTYQFEAAWDAILSDANPFLVGLLNEEYCATKRLYNAFNIRSNNVGAAVTASSLPPVKQIVRLAFNSLINFIRTVAYNGNVAAAGAVAKIELIRATSKVQL